MTLTIYQCKFIFINIVLNIKSKFFWLFDFYNRYPRLRPHDAIFMQLPCNFERIEPITIIKNRIVWTHPYVSCHLSFLASLNFACKPIIMFSCPEDDLVHRSKYTSSGFLITRFETQMKPMLREIMASSLPRCRWFTQFKEGLYRYILGSTKVKERLLGPTLRQLPNGSTEVQDRRNNFSESFISSAEGEEVHHFITFFILLWRWLSIRLETWLCYWFLYVLLPYRT